MSTAIKIHHQTNKNGSISATIELDKDGQGLWIKRQQIGSKTSILWQGYFSPLEISEGNYMPIKSNPVWEIPE